MKVRLCAFVFLPVGTIYLILIFWTLSSRINVKFRFIRTDSDIKGKPDANNFRFSDAAFVSNPFNKYSQHLSIETVIDPKGIATAAFSKISHSLNRPAYHLGEMIHVRIELYDGYGKQLSIGGDVLRIWMTGLSQNANVNGYVTDHGNGSYTGHVMALWTGKSIIKTSIANTKQQVSLVQNHIEKHGQIYAMLGGFGEHDKVVERTTCSVKPDVYGLTDMCNLTKANYDNEWYCGRPTNPNLTCSDWITMHDIRTNEINQSKINTLRSFMHQQLQHIIVNVVGDHNTVTLSTRPCHRRPRVDTWNEESPVGFHFRNKWQLRACRSAFIPSKKSYENCFRNHHLFFLGDSNVRSWFWKIQNLTHLSVIRDKRYTRENCLMLAKREDLNITMTWACHEKPYYSGQKSYSRKNIMSNAWHLDQIPPHKKVLVVLHYTYHVIRITPKVVRAHIRNLKQGLIRLFKRNANAKVFIKGPHSSTMSRLPYMPVDYTRKVLEQILYEELRELHNEIVYLDGWDLTTGIQNVDVHPSDKSVSEMVSGMMGYFCGR